MSTHSIAVSAGDGIGKEVVPAAIECPERIVELHGLNRSSPVSTGVLTTMAGTGGLCPADGLELLAKHDAIFLAAVGSPEVPDAESPGAC
jgi:tartrate dehydrogenase/decarboxylase/D-malate dehydrogenase